MTDIETLKKLPQKHNFFVGIDSDGCVFDTMEIKQKECFCPAFIKHFGLQAASKFARDVWTFVNLYSKSRGCNRYIAVETAMKLISEYEEFARRDIKIPNMAPLQAWLKEESKLGIPALEKKVAASNDPLLRKCLEWAYEVDSRIEDMVFGIPPFPSFHPCLKLMHERCDLLVVSQTPFEALNREWSEHGIDGFVHAIAGQEAGTKAEHLKAAAVGKYDADKILMIGDAPGDLKAAQSAGTLFFPIIPGDEDASWAKLTNEGLNHFFAGTYAGKYQDKLLAEFDKALPANPPWKS